ncbi:hypothetical protein TNCV_1376621 [Trichonephila clavipes]|nr:hypothetical protein TNCV_1376621 [Trichonephila clavipes]
MCRPCKLTYSATFYFQSMLTYVIMPPQDVLYLLFQSRHETGSVEIEPRPGGPSKLTSRAKRMIVRSATNKPMPSAQNFTNELVSSCNVSMSAQIVKNVLHRAGSKARTPRKKPLLVNLTGKDV